MDQQPVYFRDLGDVFVASFQDTLISVINYAPKIVGALLILLLGWILAAALSNVVTRLVRATQVDGVMDRLKLNQQPNLNEKYRLLSGMLGQFVKWFVIVVTLIAVANSLDLPQVTDFIHRVALYIPNAIVALVILTFGILLADFMSGVSRRALDASELPIRHKDILTRVVKYAIIVFSIMAAMVQLGIAPQLIQILFAGIVFSAALAFGLGGREEAARFLATMREKETNGR